MSKRRIYLDHASATPVDPKVMKAMLPYLSREFGNPSAIYKEGVASKKALEAARRDIARVLSARPAEIVFTNGATESLNLALRGAVAAWKSEHSAENPEIIVSSIEHEAVLGTARALSEGGAKIIYVKPDNNGIISARDVEKLISKRTALISVMYANNEIGTVQPIKEIGRAVRRFREASKGAYPLFHTDAVQAANYLPLHVGSLGVDLLTLGAGKIYGPKGTGLLYIRKGTTLMPMLSGGGQERGIRPGTENVASAVGFATALALADKLREKESKRLSKLRDAFIKNLLSLPGVVLNGDAVARLPNNVNVSISGVGESELFVLRLDAAGIACSTKSACNEGSDEASHVIISLGKSETEANSALRMTLGRSTTAADLNYAFKTIKNLINAS